MRNRIHLLIIADTSASVGGDYGHEALRLGRSLDPEQFAVAVIALHDGPLPHPQDNPNVPVHGLGLAGNTKPWNPLARWKLSCRSSRTAMARSPSRVFFACPTRYLGEKSR